MSCYSNAGYICILENPATPGAFKISSTTTSPEHYAAQWRLCLRYSRPFNDCIRAKRLVFSALKQHRLTEGDGLFNVTLEDAIAAIEQVGGAEARLHSSFISTSRQCGKSFSTDCAKATQNEPFMPKEFKPPADWKVEWDK